MNENGKLLESLVNDPLAEVKDITFGERNLVENNLLSSQLHPLALAAALHVQTGESNPQELSHSLEEKKQTNASEVSKPIGQIDMPATSHCNMCCRKDDVCVNLQNNHATVLTVSDITRLPSWDIRQILASVCSRCLVYISAITDSSTKLRMRCEQAMHSQNVVLAPPTPDTSPNNFLQVSQTLLDDTPEETNNEEQQQRNCYGPGYCEETPNNVSIPLTKSSPSYTSNLPAAQEKSIFRAISRSPSPNAAQNSMLEIHYEQAVSPLNTESGGGGTNRKRNYQRIQVIPVQMICTHCNRAYWRKDYYRKHMRRCSAKYRYAKSVVSQRSRSRSRLELDAFSVASEGNDQVNTIHRARIFRCNVCTSTFDKIGELKKHKISHLPRYFCDICSSEYTTQNEYDFHRAQCEAKNELFTSLQNGVAPARRKTRSYSRAVSVTPSKVASPQKVKSPAKKRSRSPNKKVGKAISNDDEPSNITNYGKRKKSINDNKLNNEKDFNSSADEDDDGVSETETLYSKRMSLTNHWVEEHSISSHSYLSQCDDNYIDNFAEDIPFKTLKEYDLYLLDRLKIEVRLNYITCFVPDCKFACSTLNEIMVHDYIYHYKKPWFNCHKCGYCFTSKVFLDYHLDLQNKGRYVCYKCGGHFEYQHQLDRHLIQHSRVASSGGEKYICHFCNLKFLDEDKLLKHCNYENHDGNQKRRMIQIDHSMTITNKVHQKRRSNNIKYQVKIFNMVVKLLPTKRCTPMEKYRFHLPSHLRMPKRIGKVEFPYPSNPNCVGCL